MKKVMRILPTSSDRAEIEIGTITDASAGNSRDYSVVPLDKKLLENAKKSFELGLVAINKQLELLERPAIDSLWQDPAFPKFYVRVVDVSEDKIVYVKYFVSDDRIYEAFAKDYPWFKQTYRESYIKKDCNC